MNKFKDFLKTDLKNVFINVDEFADFHLIDGERKKCIVDDDIFEERPSNQISNLEGGVYISRKSVFINMNDLKNKPEIQEIMELDGVNYLIENVKETEGLYEIVITRNEY